MNWFATFREQLKKTWVNLFWKNPNRLWALKVAASIAFLLIPVELFFHDSFYGTTMALGVVAMALGETDVHPIGRLKSAGLSLILFFVISSLVSIFYPFPPYFFLLILVASFLLSITGGMNARAQGVTFGSLLIFSYTMLGADYSEQWFYQPLLFTIGAFSYSVVSILLLRYRPYRLLKEQLARGFHFLADYIEVKANLFPSDPQVQMQIRTQLAQKNIALAQQIELCKSNLYSFSAECSKEERPSVDFYYQKWFLLQEMQERAISSHEQYDILSREVGNRELLEGFGQLMRELGKAMHRYSESLLTEEAYKHPLSLEWTLTALKQMLDGEKGEAYYPTLSLLMKNLSGLERNLREEEMLTAQIDVTVFNSRKPETTSLSALFNPSNSRFKFAMRLTISWLIGYGIMQLFHIEKGAWIMLTSLLVFQQTYSATRIRLKDRIFGTVIGILLGITLAQLLPTLAGQILLLICSIYLFFYWLKKNYVVAAIFITTYVLASFNLLSDQGVAMMYPRIVDTLLGGAIAYLVVRYVWPDWQYKQLPGLLQQAMTKNKRYFESIYEGSVTEEEYLHNRRTAYNADNALTSAWKGMRLEPKNRKEYEERAFTLTNLNHALLSYISAFGVHKRTNHLSEKEQLFCREISTVLAYVTDMLEGKSDSLQHNALTQKANSWEECLEELQKDPTNTRAGLIYNISHVTRELLVEAPFAISAKLN